MTEEYKAEMRAIYCAFRVTESSLFEKFMVPFNRARDEFWAEYNRKADEAWKQEQKRAAAKGVETKESRMQTRYELLD